MKNAIKEIFIMLLLCLAIALILAVVFYDYNPINKEIPKTLEYQFPSDLSEAKEDIDTQLTNSEEEQVIRTYEVTQDDLNRAKKTNYDAGKANPFMAYSENTTSGNATNSTNTTNSNANTNNNSNTDNGSSKPQENYMGNKVTK